MINLLTGIFVSGGLTEKSQSRRSKKKVANSINALIIKTEAVMYMIKDQNKKNELESHIEKLKQNKELIENSL